jgi:hypothetical protein
VVGRFSDMAALGVLAVVLDHAPLCVGNVVGSNAVVLSEWCVGSCGCEMKKDLLELCLGRWTRPRGDFDKHPAGTVGAVADPAESGQGLVEKVEDLRCVWGGNWCWGLWNWGKVCVCALWRRGERAVRACGGRGGVVRTLIRQSMLPCIRCIMEAICDCICAMASI